MSTIQDENVVPPTPFSPMIFVHESDLFILSNETMIPDISMFEGLKGFAKQVPQDKALKKYNTIQNKWKSSEEYKKSPYEFSNLLKITLSHDPADWLINRDILDYKVGYIDRVKYIGQIPK